MKKIYTILVCIILALAGCNKKNKPSDEYLEVGLSQQNIGGFSSPTPVLSTAVRGKVTQHSTVKLTVFVGHDYYYNQSYISEGLGFNPNCGEFVLQRCIRNRELIDVATHFLPLPDFLNETKYSVRVEGLEGYDNVRFVNYAFSLEDEFDVNEIPIELGYIDYFIFFIDENHQIIDPGIQGYITLRFKKTENQIVFSKSDNIFYE